MADDFDYAKPTPAPAGLQTNPAFVVGMEVLIVTATHNWVGRVARVATDFVVLDKCSWVRWIGLMAALRGTTKYTAFSDSEQQPPTPRMEYLGDGVIVYPGDVFTVVDVPGDLPIASLA